MVESIQAIQCLIEANERELSNLTSMICPSLLVGRVEVEDNENGTEGRTALCDGLLNSPPFLHHTLQPIALRSAKVFGYRGEKVAGFDVGDKRMICLPQAYQLFLKDLVGGLHTVYTKLRRLNITPLICNVEQVRSLRSLGAIQPGVNRCKLIEDSEFDHLYNDCNTLGSRPGRPPKRGWSGSSWRPEDEEEQEAQCDDYFYRRNRLDLNNGDGGGEVAPTSTHSAIPTLQTESALSSVGSWLAQQQSTINAFQLMSSGFLLPAQQQDPQLLIRRLMAIAASATLSTQPQSYPHQLLCDNSVNQEIVSSNESESMQVSTENSREVNREDGEKKRNDNGVEAAAPTLLCPPDAALLHPNSVGQSRENRSKSLDRRLLPDDGKPQSWNVASEGSTNGSTVGSASRDSRSTMDRSVDNEREKFLSQSASWGSSQCVDAAFDNEQQGIQCVVSKVTAMEMTLNQLQAKIDALIGSKAAENVAVIGPQKTTRANNLFYRKYAYRREK